MHYFIKGLLSGNWKYWAAVAAMCVWIVAIVDILSTHVKPPGLFNGVFFTITVILTIIAPIAYYVYDFSLRKNKEKKTKAVEEEAIVFEPRREQEIRRLLAENPEFATHCYECIHFNPDLLTCDRKFSDNISYQRVKEIRINKVTYCLYWKKA